MEVEIYSPFAVVKPLPKPKTKSITKARRASPLGTQSKPKPKTKLEAKGLTLENKKKLDIIYAKEFVRTTTK